MSPLRKSEKVGLTENPPNPLVLNGAGPETDWNPDWRHADCETQPIANSPTLGWSAIAVNPSGKRGGGVALWPDF
jgi:hypothetical protein